MAIEHVLKVAHCGSIQFAIVSVSHAVVQGFFLVMYVKLRIDRGLTLCRKKGTGKMRKRSMNLEDVRASTLGEKRAIQSASD
jgi:hypothetical protein